MSVQASTGLPTIVRLKYQAPKFRSIMASLKRLNLGLAGNFQTREITEKSNCKAGCGLLH
jgi:hypothetical protein